MCKKQGLDAFEDVLSGIGWNCCDRCHKLGDSELDFLWLDCCGEGEDAALLRGLDGEYCAVCWDCAEELKMKGKK